MFDWKSLYPDFERMPPWRKAELEKLHRETDWDRPELIYFYEPEAPRQKSGIEYKFNFKKIREEADRPLYLCNGR